MSSARKLPTATVNDSDSYWNTSSLKAFNFSDDEDQDSIEQISWDGSTATPLVSKAPNTTSTIQQQSKPRQTTNPAYKPNPRSQSARAYNRKPQFLPSPATIPNHNRNPDPSITEVVNASEKKSVPTATELVKLETEILTLKRQLAQVKRDRSAAPSRGETLRNIMVGDPYVLELYKSKEDKSALLDDAISRHDGNAVLAITLFMRDTLKRDLFSKELMSRSTAVDHYCAYLKSAGEIDELHETLSALGRTEEAAMLKYRQALTSTATTTPEIRGSSLKDCIKYYFDSDPSLSLDTSCIHEQILMMHRQSVVEDQDKNAEKSGHPVFKSHPRKASVIHKSVVSTLYYCCYYHWGEPEGILSSPDSVKNTHNISKTQFLFIALAALCRMRKWRKIEELLTVPRTLFRSSHLFASIGFEKVVDVFSKNMAPTDTLAKYCSEIENPETRCEMAVKLKCYQVAIDTMTYLKDRRKLTNYIDQIPPDNQHMREYLLTKTRATDIKWRN